MATSPGFYVETLGFSIERGGPLDDNIAIARGDARLTLEIAGDLFSDQYNQAIRGRLGSPSAVALCIEAPDLEELHDGVQAAGVRIVDALADRPWGQSWFTLEDPDGT